MPLEARATTRAPCITQKAVSMLNIAIIPGSTRRGRAGEAVAEWVHGIFEQRTDATFEQVDIKAAVRTRSQATQGQRDR